MQEKEVIMRDLNIGLIVLNKKDFKEYQSFIQKVNNSSIVPLFDKLEKEISESKDSAIRINGKEINITDLYELGSEDIALQHKILSEVITKYRGNLVNSDIRSSMELDILQPMLFFTSANYFRGFPYVNLAYNPPVTFSKLFSKVEEESFKKESDLIEQIEPYEPLIELGEVDQIYHFLLKKSYLQQLQSELNKMESLTHSHSELSNDYAFLTEIVDKALNDEAVILIQSTP